MYKNYIMQIYTECLELISANGLALGVSGGFLALKFIRITAVEPCKNVSLKLFSRHCCKRLLAPGVLSIVDISILFVKICLCLCRQFYDLLSVPYLKLRNLQQFLVFFVRLINS